MTFTPKPTIDFANIGVGTGAFTDSADMIKFALNLLQSHCHAASYNHAAAVYGSRTKCGFLQRVDMPLTTC